MELANLGKMLLVLGVVLAAVGALLMVIGKGLLPHLPGDFSFKIGSAHVFFPIATSIVLSIVLTVVLNLLFRR